MHALDKKLFRDIWRLKGAVLAIALMIASGVGILVSALNTIATLEETRLAYYERDRFADIFAHLERAPLYLIDHLAQIEGVQVVDPRIRHGAVLDVPGNASPVRGTLLSLPPDGGQLNRIRIEQGRMVQRKADNEIVVHKAFAVANELQLGDQIGAVMNGTKRQLDIVGIATSPEFVYAVAPGSLFPDMKNFGVLWLDEEAMEAAFDLTGAFNDVSFTLMRGAEPNAILSEIDSLIDPHGGTGAYLREDQASDLMLSSELLQLRNMASILPVIFLSVAAFLSNIVLARLVRLERSAIGLLKAFGYSNTGVASHYLKFAAVIVLIGTLLGCGLGVFITDVMITEYQIVFQFPFLVPVFDEQTLVAAFGVALVATGIGAFTAVRRVVGLAPATAMAPEPPADYKSTLVERFGFIRRSTAVVRMIVRHIARWPGRSALTVLGVAMGVSVSVLAGFFDDSFDLVIDDFFYANQHQDLSVSFVEARGDQSRHDIARFKGVMRAETSRTVSARLRVRNQAERSGIIGLPAEHELTELRDASGQPIVLPEFGLVLSDGLARKLNVATGEIIHVEFLERKRHAADVPVVAIIQMHIGSAAYMNLQALNHLMGEGSRVSALDLQVDATHRDGLVRKLKDLPVIVGVSSRLSALESFEDTIQESTNVMVSVFMLFAALIAVGVVYNAARISLGEQGRELASLMVLGFTRGEAATILVGELMLLVVIALPIGCGIGALLTYAMVDQMQTDLYSMPFALSLQNFARAMIVVLLAGLASSFIVARRVSRLDLVEVLKTRE